MINFDFDIDTEVVFQLKFEKPESFGILVYLLGVLHVLLKSQVLELEKSDEVASHQ